MKIQIDWSITVRRNIGSLANGQVFKHFGTEFTRKEFDPIKNYIRATWGKNISLAIFHSETVVMVPKNVDIRTKNG